MRSKAAIRGLGGTLQEGILTLPRAEMQGLERLLLAAYGAHMMHVTFVGKSLLVGDEVAELIVEYAASLARSGGADMLTPTENRARNAN